MKLMTQLSVLALCASIATVSGCNTTPPPASADSKALARAVRSVVGTSLIGTKGATPSDQNGIDDSVAGICSVGAYTASECERHDETTQPAKKPTKEIKQPDKKKSLLGLFS